MRPGIHHLLPGIDDGKLSRQGPAQLPRAAVGTNPVSHLSIGRQTTKGDQCHNRQNAAVKRRLPIPTPPHPPITDQALAALHRDADSTLLSRRAQRPGQLPATADHAALQTAVGVGVGIHKGRASIPTVTLS